MSRYVDEHRGRFGVEPICTTLGVSVSAYYQRRAGRRSVRAVEDERLLERIRVLHSANYYAYGYCRMWKALGRVGEQVPRCCVQRLMRANGIVGAKRRGKPWRTTRPDKKLIDRCAAFRPGAIDSTTASAKHTLRALARRWLTLAEEISAHDRVLEQLTTAVAPSLRDGFGIGADTAAEMLIVFGDNPERIRSEAAFAKLCGVAPVPASSGKTTRHRLARGGHRQANSALYRVVIVRMRFHQPTIDYVARRSQEGRSKREIIRCLKRFLAREIYRRVMTDHALLTTAT